MGSDRRWVFYAKGGTFRKWFGNLETVVDWSPGARDFYRKNNSARIIPEYLWFKEGITWTLVTSVNSFRLLPEGATFDKGGSSIFLKKQEYILPVLAFLNSSISKYILGVLSSTINLQVDEVRRLPFSPAEWVDNVVGINCKELVRIHREDYLRRETSHGFVGDSLVLSSNGFDLIESVHHKYMSERLAEVNKCVALESENNYEFIKHYNLSGEIDSEVSVDQITLSSYSRESDVTDLISYAVGCMMGRYSLGGSGLIYAYNRNIGFDPSRYEKFPADADGIIPITDESWFPDDAAERVREFVKVVWGGNTLVENMEWLADSLGRKAGESADEAIRRYLSTSFYKDHLQTYKKRPIYWLFSSGKQKAFECLVYLHRYNEGTLSRMRMEYVVPLQSRMQARIDKLSDDIDSATSSAQQKALQKRKEKFTKQLEELRRFDENLRPYADQRITLDLDDGVKVNYGKFGNLLAEVKAITGGKED